jgi:hypothetical protein
MDKKTPLPATEGFTPAIYDRLWSYIFRFLDSKDHAAPLGTNKQLCRAGTTPASWSPKLRFESEMGMIRANEAGCVAVTDITLVDSDKWRVNPLSLFNIPDSWLPAIGRFKIEATPHTWSEMLVTGSLRAQERFARMKALTSLELQKSFWCFNSESLSRIQCLSMDASLWDNCMMDDIRSPTLTDLTLRQLPDNPKPRDIDGIWGVLFNNKQLKTARFEGFWLKGIPPDSECKHATTLEVLRLPGCAAVHDDFWLSVCKSLLLMPRLRELELPRITGLEAVRSWGDSLLLCQPDEILARST